MILDFSGGPNIIIRVHLHGRGKQKIRGKERFEDAVVLALKMERDHKPRNAGRF